MRVKKNYFDLNARRTGTASAETWAGCRLDAGSGQRGVNTAGFGQPDLSLAAMTARRGPVIIPAMVTADLIGAPLRHENADDEYRHPTRVQRGSSHLHGEALHGRDAGCGGCES